MSSATARGSPAAASRWRGPWPSAWRPSTGSRSSRAARATTSRWRNELPAGARAPGWSRRAALSGGAERDLERVQRLRGAALRRERGRGSHAGAGGMAYGQSFGAGEDGGPAPRAAVPPASGAGGAGARRGAARRAGSLRGVRVLHLPLLSDLLGPRGRARSGRRSCRRRTTSRRCASRSTARCSRCRVRSAS